MRERVWPVRHAGVRKVPPETTRQSAIPSVESFARWHPSWSSVRSVERMHQILYTSCRTPATASKMSNIVDNSRNACKLALSCASVRL